MPGTINFLLSHPSVYLKVFILLSLVVLYNVNDADGIRKQTVYASRGLGQGALAYPSLFEPVTLVYLGRQHGKSVMTCMLVLSGRMKFMVMHGGVKKIMNTM